MAHASTSEQEVSWGNWSQFWHQKKLPRQPTTPPHLCYLLPSSCAGMELVWGTPLTCTPNGDMAYGETFIDAYIILVASLWCDYNLQECKKATHMQDRNTPAMICDTIQSLGLSVVVLFVYIAHLYWVKVHRFNVLLLLHGHYVTYGSYHDLQFRTWIYIAITCLKCFNSNSVAHLCTY